MLEDGENYGRGSVRVRTRGSKKVKILSSGRDLTVVGEDKIRVDKNNTWRTHTEGARKTMLLSWTKERRDQKSAGDDEVQQPRHEREKC